MGILFSDANSYQRNSAFVTYDRINMRRTNMVFFIIILTKKCKGIQAILILYNITLFF